MTMTKRKHASLKNFKLLGEKQQWKCKSCHHLLTSTAQIDHKIALQHGGTNDLSNLQILCVQCHARKTQTEQHRPFKKCWIL